MATRVTLLHNPTAGFEQYSTEQLLKFLRKKGYEPTYVPTFLDDYTDKLNDPGDIVVIAGGDGTVRKIALNLIQRGIPIGLIPLGTANNVATSLGIKGTPEEIIARWDLTRKKPFDVGLISGPSGESYFLESTGFGLFPRLIRQQELDRTEQDSRQEELEAAQEQQKQITSAYQPQFCIIQTEGQTMSGNFILVEVMNIPLVGPNMNLAPEADAGDGYFDLVLVKEEEREQFSQFLSTCQQGQKIQHPLTTRRVKGLQVEWHSPHYHLDDEAREESVPIKITIQAIPGALEFLI